MTDEDKTKEQFIYELTALRRRAAELEALAAKRKKVGEEELKEAREYAQNLIHSSIECFSSPICPRTHPQIIFCFFDSTRY